jgi:hypothetical protein
VIRPSGKVAGKGVVGKPYSQGHLSELLFKIENGSSPFAAGDRFTVNVRRAKSWAELAEANGYENTPDGTLKPGLSGEYPQTVRSALVGGVINGIAEAKPCLDWLDSQLLPSAYPLRWRFSIVPN